MACHADGHVAALVLVECAGLTGGGHSLVAREGGEAKQALDLYEGVTGMRQGCRHGDGRFRHRWERC